MKFPDLSQCRIFVEEAACSARKMKKAALSGTVEMSFGNQIQYIKSVKRVVNLKLGKVNVRSKGGL